MSDVEAREAAFWDTQASGWTEANLRVDNAAHGITNQRRLALLGDVRGKRVLDVGCGTGIWSVLLAMRGAEVWAIDISPQSILVTQKRAVLHGVEDRVHASVMSAMALEFPDASFDLVHGQDIIHHLDAAAFGAEIARVLVPQGRAVFSENSANNRLLMFARDTLCGRWGVPKWSSDDEYPLTRSKLSLFARYFGRTAVEYPEFFFFLLLNAKLFGFKNRIVNQISHSLDSTVYKRLPFLRPYSYRQLICCQEPQPILETALNQPSDGG